MIRAVGLRKTYGTVPVLHGVDLDVPAGTVSALLGANGAGKTTTVRILTTLTRADAGRAEVAGHDVVTARSSARRALALTGQEVALDAVLTGRENLVQLGRLTGLTRTAARTRAGDLLDRFGLEDAADRRVGTYSGGMRRRVDVAASLVGRPAVLFLDEPTTGLDPRGRQETWQAVRELAESGTTVLLTTQYLEEADVLAGHIDVLHAGRVVASGSAAELKARVGGHRVTLTPAGADARARLRAVLARRGADPGDAPELVVAVDDPGPAVRRLLDEVDPDGCDVAALRVSSATLDDVFLALTTDDHPDADTDRRTNHRTDDRTHGGTVAAGHPTVARRNGVPTPARRTTDV